MQLPIQIELHRSRLLFAVLVLFHAVAAVCVLVLPWPWPARSLAGVPLLSLWFLWRRQFPIAALRLGRRGELHCLLPDGERVSAAIAPESTVFEHLVVLRLTFDDSKSACSLALVSDSMPEGQFRRLRVWLRWRASVSGDEAVSV